MGGSGLGPRVQSFGRVGFWVLGKAFRAYRV